MAGKCLGNVDLFYFITVSWFIKSNIMTPARDPFISGFLDRSCKIAFAFLCKQRFHGPYKRCLSLSSQVLVQAKEVDIQHVYEQTRLIFTCFG